MSIDRQNEIRQEFEDDFGESGGEISYSRVSDYSSKTSVEEEAQKDTPFDKEEVTNLLTELGPHLHTLRALLQESISYLRTEIILKNPGLKTGEIFEKYVGALKSNTSAQDDLWSLRDKKALFFSYLSPGRARKVLFMYYSGNSQSILTEESPWKEMEKAITDKQTYKSWSKEKPAESDINHVLQLINN